jgi:hypothetical protein
VILKLFIAKTSDKYLNLYDKFSRGKDKYATLYLAWLDEIRSYTCKDHLTEASRDNWGRILAIHGIASDSVQRTVIASIHHAVQDNMQSQISSYIEGLESEADSSECERLSDDTACYRISGWAVKSAIDRRKKDIKHNRGKKDQAQNDIKLLEALKRSKDSKLELPIGAQLLDRGGLTYIHSCLLPWVRAIEESIKQFLNAAGYRKYGKDIFKVKLDERACSHPY